MERVTLIGGGSWGTALANLLVDNKKDVLIYDNDIRLVDEINAQHTNLTKLGDITLPKQLKATNSLINAVNHSDLLVLAVPTAVTRIVLKSINELLSSKKIFCNVSKGLELKTHKRVSEIVNDEIDDIHLEAYVCLSGPSHAEEVIRRKITSVVSAGLDLKYSKLIQEIFSNKYFRVYTSNDLIGVELSGSLKNIFGLAAGIVDGLGYGINTKAALITRGLREMKRIARTFGAIDKTLDGLVGIGDLIVTCTSTLSRNYSCGMYIGKGYSLNEAIIKVKTIVEGVKTCKSAYNLSKELNLKTPIIDAIYQILYEDITPSEAISKLMSRKLINE